MCRVDEGHFVVVDYCQHRVHLLTNDLQFVRHVLSHQDASDSTSAYPRHVCVDGGKLFVGTESGIISIYQVQKAVDQMDHSSSSSSSSVDSFVKLSELAATNA